MPVWCTTSSGKAKAKIERSISFLCLPSISLSLTHTHTTIRAHYSGYSSFLASTGLGHGAWGLGWTGVRGTRGQGRSDYESVSW